MKAGLTTTEIAELTGKSKRATELRAAREGWPFEEAAVRGGRQRLYPVAGLPEDIRIAHVLRAAAVAASSSPARPSSAAALAALPKKQRTRADARLAVVRACDEFLARSSLAKHSGAAAFAALWNAGNYPAEDWVKAAVPGFHVNSLLNWRRAVERQGVAALAGKYGRHRKGKGAVETTPDVRDYLVGLLAAKPHVDAAQAMRGLRARFRETDLKLPSYRTVQRFLKTWKESNGGLFLALTDPDAHRSRLRAAFGSASESVVALNQLWEWDATPGDVMCADGRHAIVAAIDVFSRRAKAVVTPTSRASAITATLRKAMLAFGVPGTIKGDNGQDFVSRHVMRALADLNIDFIPCPPYTPEGKPHIERFLGTLSHQFVELLPGYVGHSVADRQAIRNRRSFADRRGDPPDAEIPLTAAELQARIDAWIETVYERQVHSELGMSPFEKAATWRGPVRRVEDERALDALLAEAPGDDGLRVVGKKGLKIDGGLFIAPELGALIGERVMVRYDAADLGKVFVYAADDGRFVCAAVDPAREGVDRKDIAARAKAIQKTVVAEGRRHLKRLAKDVAAERIADDILAAGAAESAVVVPLPAPAVAHETPALKEALRAAVAGGPKAPRPMTARERRAHDDVVARLAAPVPAPAASSAEERFARASEIERRIAAGEPVGDDDRFWFDGYSQTADYRARRRFVRDFGLTAQRAG